MAGQAWKYSGQLDERDLAFLQHDFVNLPMAIEYYGFSVRPLTRMALEAGASTRTSGYMTHRMKCSKHIIRS